MAVAEGRKTNRAAVNTPLDPQFLYKFTTTRAIIKLPTLWPLQYENRLYNRGAAAAAVQEGEKKD